MAMATDYGYRPWQQNAEVGLGNGERDCEGRVQACTLTTRTEHAHLSHAVPTMRWLLPR